MDHKNVRKFKMCAFVADDSPNAIAAILTTDAGEEFMISTSLAIAGEIAVNFGAALQQAAREGQQTPIQRLPERILRFDAKREEGEETVVMIVLEGNRSPSAFLGAMTPTDARRLGAKLMSEAVSPVPRRAN
jgi:hypothetical protein